jgi:hypothetical protein
MVGNDFRELFLNVVRVFGLTTDTLKRVGGIFQTTSLDEPTGRLGEKRDTTAEDESAASELICRAFVCFFFQMENV